MKRKPVAVVGGGAWGTMLAQLLSNTQEEVPLWVWDPALREELSSRGTHPHLQGFARAAHVQVTDDLKGLVSSAELIFVTVPSVAFREVVREIGDVIVGDQLLVASTRGFEERSGERLSQLILQETPARLVGSLAGPTYADELARGAPGAAVIASRFEFVVARVQAALASERIRVYGSHDLLGLEVGGAFSTLLSLACGMAHGLSLGAGGKAVVLTRGLSEITRLGVAMGADAATFQGLAVLGEVMAAALNGQGPDHIIGERLARGADLAAATAGLEDIECISTARVALEKATARGVDVPLIAAIGRVLFDGVSPRAIIGELMRRRSTSES